MRSFFIRTFHPYGTFYVIFYTGTTNGLDTVDESISVFSGRPDLLTKEDNPFTQKSPNGLQETLMSKVVVNVCTLQLLLEHLVSLSS